MPLGPAFALAETEANRLVKAAGIAVVGVASCAPRALIRAVPWPIPPRRPVPEPMIPRLMSCPELHNGKVGRLQKGDSPWQDFDGLAPVAL